MRWLSKWNYQSQTADLTLTKRVKTDKFINPIFDVLIHKTAKFYTFA